MTLSRTLLCKLLLQSSTIQYTEEFAPSKPPNILIYCGRGVSTVLTSTGNSKYPKGSKNPKGPKDQAASKGPKNPSEVQKGHKGPKGTKDPTDSEGVKNPKGPKNPQDSGDEKNQKGPKNPKGPKGPKDSTGPKGPKDATSPKGPKDATNQKGPKNPKDSVDQKNTERLEAKTGPKGTKNPLEPKDKTGPKGPKNPMEPKDKTGPKGPKNPLEPKDKTGPKGPKNPMEPKDKTGPKGPKNPMEPKDKTGPKDATGPKGPKDATGPKGPKDAAAQKGPKNPNDPEDQKNPKGPKITEGPKGPKEKTGPKGPKVTTGPKEKTGPKDVTGPKGPKDSTGQKGPKNPEDSKDETGPKGPKDASGQKGPKGPKDTSGPKGPKEKAGTKGPKNQKGPKNRKGPKSSKNAEYFKVHNLFERLKKTFSQCLNPDYYTIYHLRHEDVLRSPWAENTALLIVACEEIEEDVNKAFMEYFLNGGAVISFTSSFDSLILKRFDHSPVETPEAEKLQTYSLTYDKFDCFTAISGRYSYDLQGSSLINEVKVTQLATDADTKRVVVAEVKHEKSGSIGILSQINLEKDPSEMAISTEVFTSLKSCNSVRFEVLRHLLSRLGLNCESSAQGSTPTPIYLLTNDVNTQRTFLDSVRPSLKEGHQLIADNATTLVFDVDESYPVTDDKIPVLYDTSKHIDFNHEKYKENLKTGVLGNFFLYAEVIPSTMPVLGGLMFFVPQEVGMIAIARRQTHGQGRNNNQWLSPVGCAMFNLHVRVPSGSPLGAFIQHIVAVAAVQAVRGKPGYENLDLNIKWPNDIYFGSKIKLGGVLTKGSSYGDTLHINVGCGVNVENSNPTICINDLIRQHNNMLETGGGAGNRLEEICVEEFIGRTVTQLEALIDLYQTKGPEPVLELYYKYWLHRDMEVKIGSDGNLSGVIQGVDEYGYLKVKMADDKIEKLAPDHNSFDMMKNLIIQKS